jgi:hypothetical protein
MVARGMVLEEHLFSPAAAIRQPKRLRELGSRRQAPVYAPHQTRTRSRPEGAPASKVRKK